jgi:replicative DNA helicase
MNDFSPSPNPDSKGDGRHQEVPYDRQAEEAVLGSVLVNPDVFYDVAHFLKAEDFFLHRHRWIWEAFTGLHEQRLPIDILTVSEELERQGRLEEIGGPAYLTALISNVPSSLHAEAYGKIVEETATRRRLIEAANQIARLAFQAGTPLEDVVNDAEKAVYTTTA